MIHYNYSIASIPGDGIGREVIPEAVKCLNKVATKYSFGLNFEEYPWSCEWAKEHNGKVACDDLIHELSPFDAILLGALGNPKLLPDHISLAPLVQIRQEFDLYLCLRPAKLLPKIKSPLANKTTEDIDILVVRENSEGEYISAGGVFKHNEPEEIVIQTAIHSRKGVERIIRQACIQAQNRRKKLTMATKSNAMAYAMVFWDEVLEIVAKDFPNLTIEKMHIDALCMALVKNPERFDVIVASNLFGDILSDLTAALVGSLGLTPSANINPDNASPGLFEPVHGSAPDIAGKGIANPIATIRAAAMMLDYLGEKVASGRLEGAVIQHLAESKLRTPDLGGTATTEEVGNDIMKRI